ncbi:MAG: hypothetical protein ACFE9Z_04795 [Promethearchaeota archaeon]
MIKCNKCGDEFSYGRKISCCNSIRFGKIFEGYKRNHQWNCNYSFKGYEPRLSNLRESSGLNLIEKESSVTYNWNCQSLDIEKHHEGLHDKEYIIMYE